MTTLQGQRLTLAQHREILVQAGWITPLLGSVEYDTGNRRASGDVRVRFRHPLAVARSAI